MSESTREHLLAVGRLAQSSTLGWQGVVDLLSKYKDPRMSDGGQLWWIQGAGAYCCWTEHGKRSRLGVGLAKTQNSCKPTIWVFFMGVCYELTLRTPAQAGSTPRRDDVKDLQCHIYPMLYALKLRRLKRFRVNLPVARRTPQSPTRIRPSKRN